MTDVRPSDSDVHRVPKWRGVFVAAIALLLLTGGLAIHQYFRYSAASERLDHAYQAIAGIDELSARLLDAETGARGYLLTAAPRSSRPSTTHDRESRMRPEQYRG